MVQIIWFLKVMGNLQNNYGFSGLRDINEIFFF